MELKFWYSRDKIINKASMEKETEFTLVSRPLLLADWSSVFTMIGKVLSEEKPREDYQIKFFIEGEKNIYAVAVENEWVIMY